MIAILVICIVVLIINFDLPERNSAANDAGITSMIVAEVTPAEPVQQQTSSLLIPPEEVTGVEPPEYTDIPLGEAGAVQEEAPVTAAPTEENIVKGLVSQKQEILDRRTTELDDMKSMLAILEEQNDDPERIARYRELITKTEREIGSLEKDIDRYNSAAKE